MLQQIEVKQYITNEKGGKTGVILDIKEYHRLQEMIEGMEDSLDLKQAVQEAEGFVEYARVRKRLTSKGKL